CFTAESIPRVLVGFDTRDSSPQLAAEVRQGVEAMHGFCLCLNLVTTPQLHYAVYHMNQRTQHESPRKQPVVPDLCQIYVNRFTTRFCRGLDGLKQMKESSPVQPVLLNIDCANGIGSKVLSLVRHEMTNSDCPVRLQLYNTQTKRSDWLNKNCGADFIKLNGKAPHIYDRDPGAFPLDPGNRWATIDGDGDRLLYFYIPDAPDSTTGTGDEPKIVLLDGDRISCLFATFIKRLLPQDRKLTIGVIQTAYANAASSIYLEHELGVPVVCVPTGVKHLHRAAQKFDFGIYFEANGHGTVLYSSAALERARSLTPDHPLVVFVSLTNTTIGDAITDIMMVEYALAYLGWSLSDWAGLYKEFASRQLKVTVERPHLIQTVDAERRISCPAQLQDAIDEVVESVQKATNQPNASRAFVRPSGTENMVRVYAESITQPLTDWLATKVAILTHRLARGTGEPLPDPGSMPLP
ncbi:Phosphoacetylglucosamine mutase, partial [Fasciola hepatica]